MASLLLSLVYLKNFRARTLKMYGKYIKELGLQVLIALLLEALYIISFGEEKNKIFKSHVNY